jgi:adenylosuccinate lyase
MEVFPVMIRRELDEYLPYLSTTRILTAALQKGCGREVAHKAIKQAALYAIKQKREQGNGNGIGSFKMELMTSQDLGLTLEEIESLTSNPEVGLAITQVDQTCKKASKWFDRFPDAVNYTPEPIL